MKYDLKILPTFQNIQKIFFVGIKGVGVAPLALIAKGCGFEIEGSDIGEEFITDHYLLKNNIKINTGFSEVIISDFFG
ncbi:MAG: Mur ligase domain-containing protein [Candidatus Levybacteria bacterium]|nr:Mur ligase domain-containing protein [Candidatus Levybacteria bacterium]